MTSVIEDIANGDGISFKPEQAERKFAGLIIMCM
jgi:hypothetical protein